MSTTPTTPAPAAALYRPLALAAFDVKAAADDLLRVAGDAGEDLPALAASRALVLLDEVRDLLAAARDNIEGELIGEPGMLP